MTRLSSPLQNLQPQYEIVVIGSGYGGAIAACRLARTGRSVCVLERGRELRPGEYPDTLAEATEEVQAQLPEGHIGEKTALFDFRIGHDLSVLVGCGLGGTSLINANVSLRAPSHVFLQHAWPRALQQEAAEHGFDRHYQRAEHMLGSTPYPQDGPPLRKLRAHEQSARALGKPLHRPPLNVNFRRGVNAAGVPQAGCSLCGDCVTGCNYGAKNTTLMNYLPDAHHHGAQIFTEIAVRYIEPDPSGTGWRVHVDVMAPGREFVHPRDTYVRAEVVILGAGSLGSTEILLRSREHGLSMSPCLGANFSGNADFVGFAYDCREPINSIGTGSHPHPGREPVGPCITSYIDLRAGVALDQGLIVAEGSIPGALASLLPAAFGLASAIEGQPAPANLWDRMKATARAVQSDLFGAYTGAVQNTQTYLVTGHDSDRGKLRLVEDHLRVEWPGVGRSSFFASISQTLEHIARPLGGTYLKEPLWNRWTREQLVTVHPLGGCAMADDAARGVVNHKGQVFSGSDGSQVHRGLYVMDGSTVSTPLGVPPLLTICALAERSCELLAADFGWTIAATLPQQPIADPDATTRGVQLDELLVGHVTRTGNVCADTATKSPEPGADPIAMTLTIAAADVESLLGPAHGHAQITGTVDLPSLSKQPLWVQDGSFQLAMPDSHRAGAHLHRYRLRFVAPDGQVFFVAGHKAIQAADLQSVWHDHTTLHCTIYAGADEHSPIWGHGLLSNPLPSFATQLSTIKVTGSHSPEQRIATLCRFGVAYAGPLFETYGRVVSEALPYHGGRPRKKRPLRVDPPQTHYIRTRDGVMLRLLRYHAGGKGPVLLVPGLGVSSLIFATDTIDTNLVEYLAAHDYDVWLLDPRTSIALPSASQPATADDVATQDYPAALAAVRAHTGSTSVQIVAHCFGATALLMSLLSESGLSGVRSVVISQSACDIVVPFSSELQAGLHLPGVLEELGVSSLSAGTGPGWADRLFDRVSALGPQALAAHDTNPVSRRITFLYGRQYALDQLSALTYSHGLQELFGVANLAALEHVSTLVSAGHLVDAQGREVYMSRFAERLALPITFLHGADNRCYLPESSERTHRRLVQIHGSARYARHLLPGYGHLDSILGKDAARDVYPHIVAALDAYASDAQG